MKNGKEIKLNEIWNEEKKDDLKKIILSHSREQSDERRLRNEWLSIQYQIEDYIDSDSSSTKMNILDFVKMYLKILKVTQKKFANLFEMKDSNLHKYLVGERKLNFNIVLKLSSFSHTSPELWLRIQVKNELMEISKERVNAKKYQKYDYKNLLVGSGDQDNFNGQR